MSKLSLGATNTQRHAVSRLTRGSQKDSYKCFGNHVVTQVTTQFKDSAAEFNSIPRAGTRKKIKAISLGRSGFLISILKLAFISHPPAPRAAWVLFLNSNLLTELQLFQQPTNCCREQTSSVLLQLQPAPRAIPTHRRADTGLSAGRALLPSDLSSSHRTSHPDNGRPRGLP